MEELDKLLLCFIEIDLFVSKTGATFAKKSRVLRKSLLSQQNSGGQGVGEYL